MDTRIGFRRTAGSVALTYAGAASLWIIGTDITAGLISGLSPEVIAVSVSKGLFFVLATSLGLYVLVRAHLVRIQAAQAHRHRADRMLKLGELAANIANDFNGILRTCRTSTTLLENRSSDPDARDAIERMSGAIDRGETLTREVLSFATPKAPAFENVPVAPFFEQIAEGIRRTLGEVSLAWSVEPGDLALRGDSELLERALINVIVNARESMSRGGVVVVRARPPRSVPPVLLQSARRNDFVEITVHDTGCGIAPELLARMFEPMVTTKRDRTGLGLAIVQRIVHDHGGVVSADSVEGAGTTVSIILPAWNARRAPQQ